MNHADMELNMASCIRNTEASTWPQIETKIIKLWSRLEEWPFGANRITANEMHPISHRKTREGWNFCLIEIPTAYIRVACRLVWRKERSEKNVILQGHLGIRKS